MIKSIVFVVLAAFFSASLVMVRADEGAAVPVSSKIRKAAAAGIPAYERKLQSTVCYQDGGSGQASQASCGAVGSCSAFACCTDPTSCVGLGQFWCEIANGFAIENVNDPGCPYKWSCCY
jgi:hypothetical protein